MIKMYNPGSRIYEKLAFDHPTRDAKIENTISYFQLDAPEKAFFEVPSEIEVETISGPQNVAVRFADRIQRDYREYGVIRIDLKPRKAIEEDDNVALNEKDAKVKGDRLYADFLKAKAREHIERVEQVYAIGGVPGRARGIYAQALKFINMEDPADKVGTAVKRSEDSAEMAQLKAQIEALTALVKQAQAK